MTDMESVTVACANCAALYCCSEDLPRYAITSEILLYAGGFQVML